MQGAQIAVGTGGRGIRPQDIDQLLACVRVMPICSQEHEHRPHLPGGHLDSTPLSFQNDPAADPHSRGFRIGHDGWTIRAVRSIAQDEEAEAWPG